MLMRRPLVLLAILGAASAVAVALLVQGQSNATAERADLEARTQEDRILVSRSSSLTRGTERSTAHGRAPR